MLIEELSATTSATDRWGGTPLDDAIRQGRNDIEQYLKSKGATKTVYTQQPDASLKSSAAAAADLCDAAYVGNVAELTALATKQVALEGPHVINRGDYDSRTPLHLAASEGRLDVAKTLVLEFGAHPSPEDRWGGTPMQDVMRFNTQRHQAVADFLRSVHATNLPFRSVHFWNIADADIEMSRLCVWVTRGETMMAKRILLQTKAHGGFQLLREQLTATDRLMGSTVLHWAAHAGVVELVELLMEYAHQLGMAPIEFLDRKSQRDGSCALHIAARQGHSECVGFLMRARADANTLNDLKNSALHEACIHSHADVAKVILQLQKNMKLHKKNSSDFTPLAAAVNAGNNDTVCACWDLPNHAAQSLTIDVVVGLHRFSFCSVPRRPSACPSDTRSRVRACLRPCKSLSLPSRDLDSSRRPWRRGGFLCCGSC